MAGGMAARAPTLLLFWPLWIGAVRQLKRLLSSSSGPIPIHPAPVPPYRRIPTSATASGSGRARSAALNRQE
uniref:Secreted protein n=1 Tax=Oryza rufipogon TaxID=4529 RepID=A0A0E0Q963_ORYRU